MNNIDKQYKELLEHILRFGNDKDDRTGTGTLSHYGWQLRHNMKDGFPLLTTKKVHFKSVVVELLWFLRGDTNIKYLVDNDCHIWDGDAYKNYVKWVESPENQNNKNEIVKISTLKEDFIKTIKGDDEIVKKMGKRYCDEFTKKWGDLGPIYGAQWRGRLKGYGFNEITGHPLGYSIDPKLDQITDAINLLKTDPDSRRIIVSAWNVADLKKMVLPPCHNFFQFYTRKLSKRERYMLWFQNNFETGMEYNEDEEVDFSNKYYNPTPERAISIMVNLRSNDVPLGLPFNIASYALLLEIFARMVNMVSEDLIINIGDAHIYKNQIDGIKEQITRIPYQLPKLQISDKVDFNGTIDDMLASCSYQDFKVLDYQSHPSIKMPLSN